MIQVARKTEPLELPDTPKKDDVKSIEREPATNTNAENSHKNPPPLATVVEVRFPEAAENETYAYKHREQRRDRWKVALEALTLFGVLAYGFVAYRQWGQMIIANGHATDSANAANAAATTAQEALKEARDNFRRDQRPYIWITNNLGLPSFVAMPRAQAEGFGQAMWNVFYTNYGKAPAYGLTTHSWVRFGNGPFLPTPSQKPAPGKQSEITEGGPLPPTKVDFMTACSGKVTPERFNQLLTIGHSWGISIRVRFDYTDAYGGKYDSVICLAHYWPNVTKYCPGGEMK